MSSPQKKHSGADRPARRSVFERHRILTGLVVAGVMLLVLAGLAEVALRLAGFEPYRAGFERVNTLVVYDQFCTDETGILKMNPAWYAEHREVFINSDGFRDEEIAAQLDTDRQKIMFVGDSFTYGLTAEPITECFVDCVERAGYTCFNFGIGATDPVQYAAVAEHYVPIVKPDMLAVMIYLGNDVNRYPQQVVPHKPIQYATNAGIIYAFDAAGRHLSPEEAYEYYCGGFWNTVEYYTRKSVVLCFIGRSFAQLRNKLLMEQHRETADEDERDRNQYVMDSLAKIRQVAEAHDARVCCFLIPARPSIRHKFNRFEGVQYVFDGLDYVYEEFPESEYCAGRNAHFNNDGHRRMADIICRVIEDPDSPFIRRN
jgi:hypothetical protein